jgi:CheY-like chemotaxis protein
MEKDCSGGACRSGRAAPNDDQRDAPEPTTWSRELAAQCRLVQGGCPVKVLIVEDDMIIATDLAAMIEEHGGIVVATTSASTDPETLRRMQAVDCSAIVQKPILSMELCQAIRRVMRKEKRT